MGQWWTKEGLFDCGALWIDTREPSWHAGENSFILWHGTVIKSQSYLLNLNVTSSPVLFQIIVTPSFISFGARPQGASSIRIWTITFWRPTTQKFSKTWLWHLVKKIFQSTHRSFSRNWGWIPKGPGCFRMNLCPWCIVLTLIHGQIWFKFCRCFTQFCLGVHHFLQLKHHRLPQLVTCGV